MKRNKILLDQDFAGESDGAKNFDRLMSDYHRKVRLKWVKSICAGSGVMALMLLAWLLYPSAEKSSLVVSSEAGHSSVALEPSAAVSAVQPAENLPELPFILPEVPFSNKVIKASARESFTTERGTLMEIPAGAFADTGLVEVRYREFSDVEPVLAGGLPMQFDSAGKIYPLASAGLIEVRAFSGERELQLRWNKKIKFRIKSKPSDLVYSLFSYLPEEGKWNYEGIGKFIRGQNREKSILDGPKEESNMRKVDKEIEEKIRQLLNLQEPYRPLQADKKAYQFIYRINPDQFPELYGYNNVQFQISASEREMIKQIKNQYWHKVEIHKHGTVYQAVFSNDLTVKSVEVKPVYVGNDNHVKNVFQEKLRLFQDQKQSLEEQIEELKGQAHKSTKSVVATTKSDEGFTEFEIEHTGLWNVSAIFNRKEEVE